ncbi:MAG: metal ABC transporter permease [Chlamydiales bacterium]
MNSSKYYNPYYGQDFFGFFSQLISRIFQYLTGNEAMTLTTDEVQLIVLLGVATSTALVGTFLILRRMTMLANSLSHTILIGIVGVFIFSQKGPVNHGLETTINIQAMLVAAILTGLATAFLTEFLIKKVGLQADASTGLVFTTLFAVGITLVTLLTRSAHIGTEVVMGNADALHVDDCSLIGVILLLNIALMVIFFKEYKITTFDRALAIALGYSAVFFDYLLMAQVSITAIGAFRAVGVLMVLAFITGPPLIARMWTNTLKRVLYYAVFIGCMASLIGVALSRHLLSVHGIALTTGGVVVCVIIGMFIISVLVAPEKGLLARYIQTKRLQKKIST